MTSSIVRTAAEVLRNANRGRPADAVLREVLKQNRELLPVDATEVSRIVFACYRWRAWTEKEESLEGQVARAIELAERFRRDPASFPPEALRAKAVPGWTAAEVEVSDEWLRALQREPRLWLRARHGQGGAVSSALGRCRAFGEGRLSDTLEYTGQSDLFRTKEFHAGAFEVQDVSSQAVGLICDPQPGEIWWDACAGEGGKLLHLSALMNNRGLIWASDRAAWRLQKLKRRAARAGVFNYRSAPWDGGAKLPTKTQFDGVLVDAPCSGVGTWHRNPHARWTTTLQDVAELSALQSGLLAHAAAAVKPGGKLVYAVCTLTRSETNVVADEFERRHPEFERLPVAHPLGGGPAERARILMRPQDCGGNGMFVAIWRRRTTAEFNR